MVASPTCRFAALFLLVCTSVVNTGAVNPLKPGPTAKPICVGYHAEIKVDVPDSSTYDLYMMPSNEVSDPNEPGEISFDNAYSYVSGGVSQAKSTAYFPTFPLAEKDVSDVTIVLCKQIGLGVRRATRKAECLHGLVVPVNTPDSPACLKRHPAGLTHFPLLLPIDLNLIGKQMVIFIETVTIEKLPLILKIDSLALTEDGNAFFSIDVEAAGDVQVLVEMYGSTPLTQHKPALARVIIPKGTTVAAIHMKRRGFDDIEASANIMPKNDFTSLLGQVITGDSDLTLLNLAADKIVKKLIPSIAGGVAGNLETMARSFTGFVAMDPCMQASFFSTITPNSESPGLAIQLSLDYHFGRSEFKASMSSSVIDDLIGTFLNDVTLDLSFDALGQDARCTTDPTLHFKSGMTCRAINDMSEVLQDPLNRKIMTDSLGRMFSGFIGAVGNLGSSSESFMKKALVYDDSNPFWAFRQEEKTWGGWLLGKAVASLTRGQATNWVANDTFNVAPLGPAMSMVQCRTMAVQSETLALVNDADTREHLQYINDTLMKVMPIAHSGSGPDMAAMMHRLDGPSSSAEQSTSQSRFRQLPARRTPHHMQLARRLRHLHPDAASLLETRALTAVHPPWRSRTRHDKWELVFLRNLQVSDGMFIKSAVVQALHLVFSEEPSTSAGQTTTTYKLSTGQAKDSIFDQNGKKSGIVLKLTLGTGDASKVVDSSTITVLVRIPADTDIFTADLTLTEVEGRYKFSSNLLEKAGLSTTQNWKIIPIKEGDKDKAKLTRVAKAFLTTVFKPVEIVGDAVTILATNLAAKMGPFLSGTLNKYGRSVIKDIMEHPCAQQDFGRHARGNIDMRNMKIHVAMENQKININLDAESQRDFLLKLLPRPVFEKGMTVNLRAVDNPATPYSDLELALASDVSPSDFNSLINSLIPLMSHISSDLSGNIQHKLVAMLNPLEPDRSKEVPDQGVAPIKHGWRVLKQQCHSAQLSSSLKGMQAMKKAGTVPASDAAAFDAKLNAVKTMHLLSDAIAEQLRFVEEIHKTEHTFNSLWQREDDLLKKQSELEDQKADIDERIEDLPIDEFYSKYQSFKAAQKKCRRDLTLTKVFSPSYWQKRKGLKASKRNYRALYRQTEQAKTRYERQIEELGVEKSKIDAKLIALAKEMDEAHKKANTAVEALKISLPLVEQMQAALERTAKRPL